MVVLELYGQSNLDVFFSFSTLGTIDLTSVLERHLLGLVSTRKMVESAFLCDRMVSTDKGCTF